jgi:hypothetical protein
MRNRLPLSEYDTIWRPRFIQSNEYKYLIRLINAKMITNYQEMLIRYFINTLWIDFFPRVHLSSQATARRIDCDLVSFKRNFTDGL